VLHYTAIVTREGRYWVAVYADAPGCQTQATSESSLRVAAQEALDGWLEAHLADERVPPAPRTRVRTPRGARAWRVEVQPTLAMAIQVRRARLAAGLSRSQLARKAGVSVDDIAELEKPGDGVTVGILARVARALGGRLDVRLEQERRSA